MPSRLTPRDAGVISKIKDPESSASPVLVEQGLPRDPHILEKDVYDAIIKAEGAIVKTMISLSQADMFQRAKASPEDHKVASDERAHRTKQIAGWLICLARLDKLVEDHPNYASARNNRAQALRVVYGDGMLVALTTEGGSSIPDGLPSIIQDARGLNIIAKKALGDLDFGIELLTPRRFNAVSPMQAKTLSNLYMQRGVLYRAAAKNLARNLAREGDILTRNEPFGSFFFGQKVHAGVRYEREEQGTWSRTDFEHHASMAFMMAGRYGSEMGKGLAVNMNPDAKLCGQIVAEAMRKEIAGDDTTTVNTGMDGAADTSAKTQNQDQKVAFDDVDQKIASTPPVKVNDHIKVELGKLSIAFPSAPPEFPTIISQNERLTGAREVRT